VVHVDATTLSRTAATVVAALLLCITACGAWAADTSQLSGDNWNLGTIHPKSVILYTHGVDLHIYPDAASVIPTYSGCQIIWLSNGHRLARASYKNGQIERYSGWEPDRDDPIECYYVEGKLVKATSTSEDCPPGEFFPINREGRAK